MGEDGSGGPDPAGGEDRRKKVVLTEDGHMLYDILVYREWPKVMEAAGGAAQIHHPYHHHHLPSSRQQEGTEEDCGTSMSTSSSSSSSTPANFIAKLLWSFWTSSVSLAGCELPESVRVTLEQQLPWKFCLSEDGTLMAVLQESLLEIFSSKDDFATALGRVRLEQQQRDPNPVYRQLVWSPPDTSLLAVTSSSGDVDVYDSYGFHIYSIVDRGGSRDGKQQAEQLGASSSAASSAAAGRASYAGVFFSDVRVRRSSGLGDWISELILVCHSGRVLSFLLSPSGFQEFTDFSLTSAAFGSSTVGVTAVVLSRRHNLLCVASGPEVSDADAPESDAHGLSLWRLLDDSPFYSKAHSDAGNEPGRGGGRATTGLLSSLVRMTWPSARTPYDPIYGLEESPDGSKVCAMHCSGGVTVWLLPSLRLFRKLSLNEQPGFDDLSPALLSNPKPKHRRRRRLMMRNPLKWIPTSARWWDDEAFVLGRTSGGVSLLNLVGPDPPETNLLGESSEFFAGPPAFSQSFGNGIFVLECEVVPRRQALRCSSSSFSANNNSSFSEDDEEVRSEGHDDDDDESSGGSSSSSDDEEDMGAASVWLARGKRAAVAVAYLITESDRFAPPRKRPRVQVKSYRLLSLISTTPEELFARKIDSEEYGEALIMAQRYGLDSDCVYERQWRLSNRSVSAIKDYLWKVRRRSTALRECISAPVPQNVDAVRELLNYGLRETDLDVLVRIQEEEIGGISEAAKFIFARSHRDREEDYESFHMTYEELETRRKQKENQVIEQVQWSNLSLAQRDLLSTRRLVLKYQHRLDSYLAILLGSGDDFDPEFYARFRDQSILKSAIEFARAGQYSAVVTVLDCYQPELQNYHLIILSNFPESLPPDKYSCLIPRVDENERVELPRPRGPYNVRGHSQEQSKDWLEFDFVLRLIGGQLGASGVNGGDFEGDFDGRFFFEGGSPSASMLSTWVDHRAKQFEEESSLVDHALALLQIAAANGIHVDSRLYHRILTLEMMMYDLQLPPAAVSLRRLEEMSDLEALIQLMEASISNCNKAAVAAAAIASDHPGYAFLQSVNRVLVPYLDRVESLVEGTRSTLLRSYLLNVSAKSLLPLLELFKTSSNHFNGGEPDMVFSSAEECISIGIECIFAFEGGEASSDDEGCSAEGPANVQKEFSAIIELLGAMRKMCRNPNVINELQYITMLRKAMHILQKYGIKRSMSVLKSMGTEEKEAKDLLVKMMRNAEKRRPKITGKEWFEVLQDLLELRLSLLVVPLHQCLEIFCQSLLCSQDSDNIKLVEDIFDYSPADALFKGKSSMLYTLSAYKIGSVPLEVKLNVLVIACDFYLNSSKDASDPNLGHARHCLGLVTEPEAKSKLMKWRCLLDAIDLLSDFGVFILPVLLHSAAEDSGKLAQIFNQTISKNHSAYQNVRKMLKIVRCLNQMLGDTNGGAQDIITQKTQKKNENFFLWLIADHSLNKADYDTCLAVCKTMMESAPVGNEFAVKACQMLSDCPEFSEVEAKLELASFCVCYCQPQELEDRMSRRRALSDELMASVPKVEALPEPFIQALRKRSLIPEAAIGLTRSMASVASSAADRTASKISEVPIPSAAVDISKTLATAVAAGTTAATETGSRAISSLFGRFVNLGPARTEDAAASTKTESDQETSDEEEAIDKAQLNLPTAAGDLIGVDAFYETAFPRKSVRSVGVTTNFDLFGSCTFVGVEGEKLVLLSKHVRKTLPGHSFEGSCISPAELETDGDLEVVLQVMVDVSKEDCLLGCSLILSEYMLMAGQPHESTFNAKLAKLLRKDHKSSRLVSLLATMAVSLPILKGKTLETPTNSLRLIAKTLSLVAPAEDEDVVSALKFYQSLKNTQESQSSSDFGGADDVVDAGDWNDNTSSELL